jgi:tetratricopeptide (TPR) repeat protein
MEQEARNGIEFIEAALKLFPESPKYLNTYALLVADGLGQKKLALEILEKAAQLDPDDIQIRQNIRSLKAPSQGCLVLCFGGILTLTVGYVSARVLQAALTLASSG